MTWTKLRRSKMQQNSKMNTAGRVSNLLLEAMADGKYRDAKYLPPENELAAEFGVSRTALRDGTAILEREGFITRKWGSGTMINHHVLAVRNRIDIEHEFLDMVRRCGFAPEIAEVRVERARASKAEAGKLGIREQDSLYSVERLITADGIPAIYCVNLFPETLISDLSFDEEEMRAPIFEFLERRCGVSVYIEISDIRAVNASKEIAEHLGIPEGSAVLGIEEHGHDIDGRPVMLSQEYYREGLVSHSVVRKKM